MKTVKEIETKVKGAGNEGKILTGKGSFSTSGFAEFVHAVLNDTSHKFSVIGKDGTETFVNASELVREDFKKSAKAAKHPQSSEADVYNTSELTTKGIASAIPLIVRDYVLKFGKKFELPATKVSTGSLYAAAIPAKTRTGPVRDIKTKEDLGTVTVDTKDFVQFRAQSRPPKNLQTKTRRDKNGNVVK